MKTKKFQTEQVGRVKFQKLGRIYYATIKMFGIPGIPTLKSVGSNKKTVLDDIRHQFRKKRRTYLQLA